MYCPLLDGDTLWRTNLMTSKWFIIEMWYKGEFSTSCKKLSSTLSWKLSSTLQSSLMLCWASQSVKIYLRAKEVLNEIDKISNHLFWHYDKTYQKKFKHKAKIYSKRKNSKLCVQRIKVSSHLAMLLWKEASPLVTSSPSNDHTISGVGAPSTSASSVNVSPSLALTSAGDLMKRGRTSTRFTEMKANKKIDRTKQ